MTFDLHTVFFHNMMLMLLLGVTMGFYARTQRPYPGFRHWRAAAYLIGVGYFLFLVRERMPLVVNVLAANLLIAAGGLLRLDGALLFLRDRPLPRATYPALLAPYAALLAWFTLGYDSLAIRSSVIALFIISVSWGIAAALWSHTPGRSRLLYRRLAGFFILQGALFVVRMLLWNVNERIGLFDGDTYNALFLTLGAVVEVVLNVSVILLHAERFEFDLRETQASLARTLESLEGAVAEVRTLEELLPFCAHCRKIRGEAGEWQTLDAYVHRAHGDRLSHAICPDCARAHFPAAAGPNPPAA